MLTPSSPEEYHAWVEEAWEHLGIDAAVGEWTLGKEDKDGVVALLPLLYHLKAKPHKFLNAMHLMSAARHAAGRKAMALFPLRRLHVLGHMRVDQNALDKLLGLGCEYAAQKAKSASKAPDLNAAGPSGRAPKRKRDDSSLLEEKAEVFNQVLDLRAAGVHRRHHFAFAFTTDGVSVHLNMEKPKPDKAAASKKAKAFPARGIHSIDAIKALAKAEELHTIGIDPGKRELIVAVDADDPQHAPVVRYTLAQRQRHMRTRQYVDEGRRSKPQPVAVVEEALSLFNSKAPSLCGVCGLCGGEAPRPLRVPAGAPVLRRARASQPSTQDQDQGAAVGGRRGQATQGHPPAGRQAPARVGVRRVGLGGRTAQHGVQQGQPAGHRRGADEEARQGVCGGSDARTLHV